MHRTFFEELTKLKKLTSVNIVDSPIGSIRKLADIRNLSSLCIRSNPYGVLVLKLTILTCSEQREASRI